MSKQTTKNQPCKKRNRKSSISHIEDELIKFMSELTSQGASNSIRNRIVMKNEKSRGAVLFFFFQEPEPQTNDH
jgi:hypothetical protein